MKIKDFHIRVCATSGTNIGPLATPDGRGMKAVLMNALAIPYFCISTPIDMLDFSVHSHLLFSNPSLRWLCLRDFLSAACGALAPRVGLKPTTTRLTAARSTTVTLAHRKFIRLPSFSYNL